MWGRRWDVRQGAEAGGVAGTKQDPSAMEKWQMFGKRQAAAAVESALKTF